MQFVSFIFQGKVKLGLKTKRGILDLEKTGVKNPTDILTVLKYPSVTYPRCKKILNQVTQNKFNSNCFIAENKIKFLPPIPRPPKIICIGQNYLDHCKEQGVEIPKSPVIFAKFPTAINSHRAPIILPRVSRQVDYEAELAVIIGKPGKFIPETKAMSYVAGYTIFNDVSARDLQFADGQWIRGKTCDTFAPTGPYLTTCDEITDPHNLNISLKLNGITRQSSNTKNLIFKIPYLISFLSQVITLEIGDLIATGTPPGVGCFRKPPIYLQPGDTVEITIEKLGTLVNTVASRE